MTLGPQVVGDRLSQVDVVLDQRDVHGLNCRRPSARR
jgi:hypothetical protein